MFYWIFLLCAACLAEGTFTNEELSQQFEAKIDDCGTFYQRHGYTAPGKNDQSALQLFINAYHTVNQHNSNPARTYDQVLNCFATVNHVSHPFIIPPEVEEPDALKVSTNSGSPDSYDRRDDNTSTSVKDQQSCLSCWAFVGIACMEAKYLQLTGDNPADVDFSEQQMVDCAYEAIEVTNRGCEGGWVKKGWQGVRDDQLNIMYTEEQRPYTNSDGECNIKELNRPNAMSKVVVTGVSQWTGATAAETQDRIWTEGAIAVAIRAEPAFYYYAGGLFDTACVETGTDHALTLIGYTQDSFIGKNSWGEDWGEAGFIKLSRAAGNICEWMDITAYPLMECAWGLDAGTGKCVSVEPCGGCQNNGKCSPDDSTTTCECIDGSGYEGAMCDHKPCSLGTCQNSGTCTTGTGYCECVGSWMGDSCEQSTPTTPSPTIPTPTTPSPTTPSPSLCTGKDCHNGGTCNATNGLCQCYDGWKGELCETKDECPNGGTGDDCVEPTEGPTEDLCHKIACENGGVCDSATGLCTCLDGFTGSLCEDETKDKCAEIKCQNEGKCDSNTGICKCLGDWTGEFCEVKPKDKCTDIKCQNEGKCDSNTGLCKCPEKWTGEFCEENNKGCPDLPSTDDATSTLTCQEDGDSKKCDMVCLADHFIVKGSTLTTSQKVSCDGQEWSHKSEANPNYSFDKCTKKEEPAYRTLSATLTLSGTGTCPATTALHNALQIWLDDAADKADSKYESLKEGLDGTSVCHLVADSQCTSQGDKIEYSFKLNQTKELATNHLDTVNNQLKSDAAGHNISLMITTTKRAITNLTAEAIVTVVDETCDKGSARIDDICIKCSPGYFEVEHACIMCGKDTYSEESGVTKCTACTGTKSTASEGSSDEAACVEEEEDNTQVMGYFIGGALALVLIGVVACFFIWMWCRRGNREMVPRAEAQNPRRDHQGFSGLPPSYADSPPAYTSNVNLPNFSHHDNRTLADVLEAADVEKRPL